MTESERKERIEYLEREIFMLDMKDNWDSSDYSYSREMNNELRKLKGENND